MFRIERCASENLPQGLASQANNLNVLVVRVFGCRQMLSGVKWILFANDDSQLAVHATFVSGKLDILAITVNSDRNLLRVVTANVLRYLLRTLYAFHRQL